MSDQQATRLAIDTGEEWPKRLDAAAIYYRVKIVVYTNATGNRGDRALQAECVLMVEVYRAVLESCISG